MFANYLGRCRRQFHSSILTVAISSLFCATGFAQATTTTTDDALIEKFTLVYLKLAPKDPAKSGVTLRLADLLAERARKKSAEDILKGQKDRNEAIRYYKEGVDSAPEAAQARIWIQVGHLHELNGDAKNGVDAYRKVLGMSVATPEQIADAHLSLGEVAFKARQWSEARNHFVKVMENTKAGSRGLSAYRIAWTQFNEGQIEKGIEGLVHILKTPDLLRRNIANNGGVDAQFQEEVSRDLATFMAKRRVHEKDLALIYEVSPESAKMSNVVYLAGEAERLGQNQEALQLWQFVNGKQSNPRERLESQIHIAQLQVARQTHSEAVKNYEQALALWSALGGCQGDDCKELKMRLKNIVVEWNKGQKKAPTEELQRAYQAYVKVFPEDIQMTLYLAQVARERKDYPVAYETYKAVGAAKGDNQEAALLSAIETAEVAKNKDWLKESYDAYLALSTKKEQLAQVSYQRAKLIYDSGDNEAAAVALHDYAVGKVGTPQLREQAANLALDALGLLKDDTRIQAWSAEFARALPSTANDMKEVSRKALLNQVAKLSEAGQLDEAWKVLTSDSFSSGSPADKAIYLKNKLVLAEKTKRYADARNTADEMIALSATKPEDREYALTRKAWLSELVLDFDSALTATQKLPAEKKEDAEEKRLLKLAMYADLASKETKPFYTQYLKVSKDDANRVAIASQMVKASANPLKEIEGFRPILAKEPEVLARLYLELYGKNRSPELLKKILAQKDLMNTKSAPMIKRQQTLADFAKMRSGLEAMKVDGSNQRKLAATLKARVAALTKAEKEAATIVDSGDWTSQVLYLTTIGKEHDRFYQEIMGLPLPEGLTPEQEQEYMQALAQTAAPHQTKGSDLSKKVGEFWADSKAVGQLTDSLDQATIEIRPLVENEIQILMTVAPEAAKANLAQALVPKNATVAAIEKPSVQIIEQARAAVRSNPMDRASIQNLLELETKFGRHAMVSYLKGRLESLGTDSQPAEKKGN